VVLGSWFLVLGSGRPRTQDACGSRFLVPGSRFGTPAHPGTRRIARMRAGRPRTQDACGSRFLVPGSRFGTPAHPGTRRIARMRAGTPAHPGGMWFSVPGSWFSVRDARAPRDAQDCAYAGETPAHPGTLRIARMRAGTPAHPGTLRIAHMRARRPRSWHAQDCAYAGGTPAHPGGAWFSVIAGMVRDWCQAGSGLSYCCPPGPCHISGRETETTNSFATTSRRSVARASCSMSCLARNTPLPR
jgi:hypothetical protein